MYSVGSIFYSKPEAAIVNAEYNKKLLNLAEQCCLVQYHRRIVASRALSFLPFRNGEISCYYYYCLSMV